MFLVSKKIYTKCLEFVFSLIYFVLFFQYSNYPEYLTTGVDILDISDRDNTDMAMKDNGIMEDKFSSTCLPFFLSTILVLSTYLSFYLLRGSISLPTCFFPVCFLLLVLSPFFLFSFLTEYVHTVIPF